MRVGSNYYRFRLPACGPLYRNRSTKADVNNFNRIQRGWHWALSLGLWQISAGDKQGSVAGIFFLSLYFDKFDFFACQIPLFIAGSYASPPRQKLYQYSSIWYQRNSGHSSLDLSDLIQSSSWLILLGLLFSPILTPLRNVVNSFTIASSFIFSSIFLPSSGYPYRPFYYNVS